MLTPQEQAEFDSLNAEFGGEQETGVVGQFFRPLGRAIAGIPNQLYQSATRLMGRAAGLPQEFTNAAVDEIKEAEGLHKLIAPPAAPKTGAQTAANVTGTIGGEIGKFLILRGALPGGRLGTNIASDAAVGAALSEDPLQGAVEFGALGGIASIPGKTAGRFLLRRGAEAAVPVAIDAAKGELSGDTAMRAATYAGFGGATEAIGPAIRGARRLISRTPKTEAPVTAPDAPVPVEPTPAPDAAVPPRVDDEFSPEAVYDAAFPSAAPKAATVEPPPSAVPPVGRREGGIGPMLQRNREQAQADLDSAMASGNPEAIATAQQALARADESIASREAWLGRGPKPEAPATPAPPLQLRDRARAASVQGDEGLTTSMTPEGDVFAGVPTRSLIARQREVGPQVNPSREVAQKDSNLVGARFDDRDTFYISYDADGRVPTPDEIRKLFAERGHHASVSAMEGGISSAAQGARRFKIKVSEDLGGGNLVDSTKAARRAYEDMFGGLEAIEGQTLKQSQGRTPQPPEWKKPEDDLGIPALQTSRAYAKADYDAARATGDRDAARDAERALKSLDAEINRRQSKLRLGSTGESGFASGPMVQLAGRGIIGAVGGSTLGDTPEEKARNAAIGAGLLMGAPAAGRLLRDAPQKMRQLQAQEARKGGRVASWMGEKFNAGRTAEDLFASERQKGFIDANVVPVTKARAKVSDDMISALTPAQMDALENYTAKVGANMDTAALDAAGVPKEISALARAAKEAKVSFQREKVGAFSDTAPPPGGVTPSQWQALSAAEKRAIIVNDTVGNYQTRSYLVDLDPTSYAKFRNTPVYQRDFDETVKWLKSRNPNTNEAVLRDELERYLTARQNGQDFGRGSTNRMSESLFIHRKDLSDNEWANLGALASNPAVPAPIQTVLANASNLKQLTPLEQRQIALLAGNKALGQAERDFARKVGERTILPESFRNLMGEVKNPIQKELLTVANLAKSGGAARYINEIANAKTKTGGNFAMSDAEWTAAGGAGRAKELVRLTRSDKEGSPNLGRLADKWVTPDVARRLTEAQNEAGSGLVVQMLKGATSISKQAVTVFNPGTHGRQIAQAPIMMIAGRVTPKGLADTFSAIRKMANDPNNPLWRQLREDHILGANFSNQEIRQQAIDFFKTKSGIRKLGGKTIEGIRKLYGAPDDLVRISAYLSALQKYGGDRRKAIDFVNRFTPNYGQVPQAVAWARNIPVVSPFLSWTSEMVRISKNLAGELLNGETVKDRIWAATALAGLTGFGSGVSAIGKRLMSKEDREEFEKSEKLMQSYQRNQAKLPLAGFREMIGLDSKNKAGGQDFLGLQSLTPAGDLVSFAQSLLKGDYDAVMKENPWVGLHKNPVASAMIDAVQGEHHFTGDKLETMGEKARRVAEAFVPPVNPFNLPNVISGGAIPTSDKLPLLGKLPPFSGLGFEDRKLKRLSANNGEYTNPNTGQYDSTPRMLIRNLGFNIQSTNLNNLRRNVGFDTQSKIREARADYSRDVRAGNNQEDAGRRLMRRLEDIQREHAEKMR